MANIRKWLERAEAQHGERIEAIVVGRHYDRDITGPTLSDENVVLSREVGLAKLDQEYDNSFGGADCFPMYAWTPSKIYLIGEYDGATGLSWVPRNPMAVEPQFGGG
jgi:hypothetical protein